MLVLPMRIFESLFSGFRFLFALVAMGYRVGRAVGDLC